MTRPCDALLPGTRILVAENEALIAPKISNVPEGARARVVGRGPST